MGASAHFLVWIPLMYFALGMSVKQLVGFYCVGYAFQGLYLGYVFSLNHFPMPVLHEKEDEKMGWFTLQVKTTRNMEPHWFVTWFSGDLTTRSSTIWCRRCHHTGITSSGRTFKLSAKSTTLSTT